MRVYVTYHPASTLHAGNKPARQGGPTRESLLRAIQEDLARVAQDGEVSVDPPGPGELPGGHIYGVDTEYPNREFKTASVATREGIVTWDVEGSSTSAPTSTTSSKGALTGPYYLRSKEVLQEVLSTTKVLVAHSIGEDFRYLWENDFIPKRPEWLEGRNLVDTYVLARMINEARPSFKLEDLLASRYPIKGWKKGTRSKDPATWTMEDRTTRCGNDAWGTYMLYKAEAPLLDNRPLYEFTMAYNMVLHRMTTAGAVIDKETYGRLVSSIGASRLDCLGRLRSGAIRLGLNAYDPTNDAQTREILYEKLALDVINYTQKEKLPSVDKSTLLALMESAQGGTKGFLSTLVEFNRLDKLNSTYTEGLAPLLSWVDLEDIGAAGYIPFNFITLGARTGRRSSVKPNSQNWPKRVRGMVRSRWPGGSILECDYRKLEPRVIAYLARCEKLLHFFTEGGGYIDVAKTLFKTDVKEGTHLYRAVKSIVLGVHYDMKTDLMADELWKQGIRFGDKQAHWQETDRIRSLYLAEFQEIQTYMDNCRQFLERHGNIRTPTGRVLHVGGEGKHSDNQAINGPVQGTAGDITGSALIDVEKAILREAGLTLSEWYEMLVEARKKFLTSSRDGVIMRVGWEVPTLFNEVHDSLIGDLPPGWEKKGTEIFVETMRSIPTLRALCPYLKDLPLDVDVKRGPNWGG